jgi:Zn-dependent protease with chaperone function
MRIIVFALLSIFACAAQNAEPDETFPAARAAILQQSGVMPPSAVVSVVQSVYVRMINTSVFAGGAAIGPSLLVMDSPVINAYSTAGGKLYVNRGLVEAVNGNPGMMAFFMGHEMTHSRNQHGLKRHLRAVEADNEIRMAYQTNTWAGVAAQAGHAILEAKMERLEEEEADRLGLLMAAEAGYHPDFAILASRQLRMKSGESSKFAAFFEGHPRWTTREQSLEGIRARALTSFQSRWPDVALSPGSVPPTMTTVENLRVTGTKRELRLLFRTDVRYVKDAPVQVSVVLIREKTAKSVILQEQTFLASGDKNWDIALGGKPKDNLGKRCVRIIASMEGRTLYDTEAKKID